ncbi:hypothetical protein DFH06DRAFT_565482 [Mycena polygramma]|nr:hypothetical protein DFH06DRAFT_565482 [Mycena polygramma]
MVRFQEHRKYSDMNILAQPFLLSAAQDWRNTDPGFAGKMCREVGWVARDGRTCAPTVVLDPRVCISTRRCRCIPSLNHPLPTSPLHHAPLYLLPTIVSLHALDALVVVGVVLSLLPCQTTPPPLTSPSPPTSILGLKLTHRLLLVPPPNRR